MTVGEARALLLRRLEAAAVASPAAEATALLEDATGLGRSELLLQPERPLCARERLRLLASLRRRTAREPLQHVLGHAHFYGLELAVGPDVLVPRAETERLVELVLAELRGAEAPAVLDVGTGSGAIALALAAERADAEVMATDVAPEALAVARANGERLALRVVWARSDLLAAGAVAAFAARATAVVANLPYLPEGDVEDLEPEVRADPALALFSGRDGLAHARRLVSQARALLAPGALLALELDPRNVGAALRWFAPWRSARIERDLVGRQRFLLARR